jgi:hypothetical protein
MTKLTKETLIEMVKLLDEQNEKMEQQPAYTAVTVTADEMKEIRDQLEDSKRRLSADLGTTLFGLPFCIPPEKIPEDDDHQSTDEGGIIVLKTGHIGSKGLPVLRQQEFEVHLDAAFKAIDNSTIQMPVINKDKLKSNYIIFDSLPPDTVEEN